MYRPPVFNNILLFAFALSVARQIHPPDRRVLQQHKLQKEHCQPKIEKKHVMSHHPEQDLKSKMPPYIFTDPKMKQNIS